MEKSYKPTYGISMVLLFVGLVLMAPGIALVFYFQGESIKSSIGYGGLFCTYIGIMLAVIMVPALIIKAFSKVQAVVGDGELRVQQRRISLAQVKYVSLQLPVSRSRYGGDPQHLCVWVDDKNYIVIKRPAISLIARMKKECYNAEFVVEEWKSWVRIYIFSLFICPIILVIDRCFLNHAITR